jgi:hypothetical protein
VSGHTHTFQLSSALRVAKTRKTGDILEVFLTNIFLQQKKMILLKQKNENKKSRNKNGSGILEDRSSSKFSHPQGAKSPTDLLTTPDETTCNPKATRQRARCETSREIMAASL